MKTNATLKNSFVVLLFLWIMFPSSSAIADTINCNCANGSLKPFIYPEVGTGVNVPSDDYCNQTCANRGAKYYSYSNLGNIGFTKVTKQANAAIQAPVATNYIPMEKIPGAESQTTGDFYTYVQGIYKFGIWGVGIAAFMMIIIGGFMYITSAGNNSSMEKAKGVITDAIVGLLLAMLSWLLLYIINPDLVKIKKLDPVGAVSEPTPMPALPTPIPSGTYSHADATSKLSASGIITTSSGQCSDQNNKKCTSLNGIPQSTIEKIIQIKTACNCSFSITGGTETGHKSHGTGQPVLDLSFNQDLANYLLKNASSIGISMICTTLGDSAYRYNCSTNEEVRHLHVSFK